MSNNKYNDEPVWYCRTCLSLKVINLEDEMVPCYCGDINCGSTDIGTTSNDNWEKMYKRRYHKKF